MSTRPTIMGRKGMVFGTPGGDQQDQWTLQFFLNVVEFGLEVQDAIEAPRFSTDNSYGPSVHPHPAPPPSRRGAILLNFLPLVKSA